MTSRATRLKKLRQSGDAHDQYIYKVARTYRGRGAVGERSKVIDYVFGHLTTPRQNHAILDYGCGYYGFHVLKWRDKKYNIHGYDVMLEESLLQHKFFHQYLPTHLEWDIIYASSVLNVQPDMESLKSTLRGLTVLCMRGTGSPGLFGPTLVVNYPEPHKGGLLPEMVEDSLKEFFTINKVYHDIYRCYLR